MSRREPPSKYGHFLEIAETRGASQPMGTRSIEKWKSVKTCAMSVVEFDGEPPQRIKQRMGKALKS